MTDKLCCPDDEVVPASRSLRSTTRRAASAVWRARSQNLSRLYLIRIRNAVRCSQYGVQAGFAVISLRKRRQRFTLDDDMCFGHDTPPLPNHSKSTVSSYTLPITDGSIHNSVVCQQITNLCEPLWICQSQLCNRCELADQASTFGIQRRRSLAEPAKPPTVVGQDAGDVGHGLDRLRIRVEILEIT